MKKSKFQYCEFELMKAFKWCIERGIKFYPVLNKTNKPRVFIEMSVGSNKTTGIIEYSQDETMYDKIRELYLHKYKKFHNLCLCENPFIEDNKCLKCGSKQIL